MTFEECVNIVLGHEGVLSDDGEDPGGLTKFGISKNAYPLLDIHALTIDDAISIYRKDYWDTPRIDKLPAKLRLMVFDCAVNQGCARAAMFVQRACGAPADGKIGPKTLMMLEGFNVEFLIDSIARQRWQAYKRHPKFSNFGGGWGARLLDITLRTLIPKPTHLN